MKHDPRTLPHRKLSPSKRGVTPRAVQYAKPGIPEGLRMMVCAMYGITIGIVVGWLIWG